MASVSCLCHDWGETFRQWFRCQRPLWESCPDPPTSPHACAIMSYCIPLQLFNSRAFPQVDCQLYDARDHISSVRHGPAHSKCSKDVCGERQRPVLQGGREHTPEGAHTSCDHTHVLPGRREEGSPGGLGKPDRTPQTHTAHHPEANPFPVILDPTWLFGSQETHSPMAVPGGTPS